MKKSLLLFSVLCASVIAFGQIKVQSNGNVGVNVPSSTTVLSKFSVGGAGDASALAHIGATSTYGLKITNGGSGDKTGLYVQATACGGGAAIGIFGLGNENPNSQGCNGTGIGVRGLANRYGVSGLIPTGSTGAAIYGGFGTTEAAISGSYVGYFNGNVKVIGTVNGVNIGTSDIRYKKDISDLHPEKSLKSILMMRPVEYYLEQQYVNSVTLDTLTNEEIVTRHPVYDEKSEIFQKKHYGLIAQELQKLYPDLVYTLDNDGYLGINYVEIIPMLIQSVQELNKRIEMLETDKDIVIRKSAPSETEISGNGNSILDIQPASLQQNAPNPFSQSTQIKYYLPQTAATAYLCIYDLQGKQLKQITISERGEGSQTILGSQFTPGIYLYALLADGKEVDVKRMILTE